MIRIKPGISFKMAQGLLIMITEGVAKRQQTPLRHPLPDPGRYDDTLIFYEFNDIRGKMLTFRGHL